MNVQEQIQKYITSQPEPKRSDMQALHVLISQVLPEGKLWFLDGKDSENKTVSNHNIGYGSHTIKYTDGTTREFYQIGISANKTGISVYILGIKDKKYLAQTYGNKLGKASVTGYCIRFKTLKDINIDVLEAAIRYGVEQSSRWWNDFLDTKPLVAGLLDYLKIPRADIVGYRRRCNRKPTGWYFGGKRGLKFPRRCET